MANSLRMSYDNDIRDARGGDALKEIDETNFSEFIRQPVSVLIFSSPWCTSCKSISSRLEALSRNLENRVAFGICDISVSPLTPARMQVLSVPAVIVFENGKEVKRLQGPASEAALSKVLEPYR